MSATTTSDGIAQFLSLSKLQIKNLFETLQPSPLEYADNIKTRLLVLADLLERLSYLNPASRVAILRGIWAAVNRIEFNPMMPMRSIYFADGSYCCWTAAEGWLDLDTGETVLQLPAQPAETISYNLDVLEQTAIKKLDQKRAAGEFQRPMPA